MTLSNATSAGVRPITPTLCPARSAICWTFCAGFFGALVRKSGRRPQDKDVLTHNGNSLRVGRHLEIATSDRKVGLASTKQGKRFDRAVGRDQRQPDCPAFTDLAARKMRIPALPEQQAFGAQPAQGWG